MWQKKADRLITPGASSAEIAADYASLPFDRACRDADAKWGIDRLPGLVAPATALRFGKAVALMNAAITKPDPEAAAAYAENCAKGITAMDREATASGHRPASPDVWEFEMDQGEMVGIIRDGGDWQAAQALRPNLRIYTLREAAMALQHYGGLVTAVKDTFPGSAVTAVRNRVLMETDESLDDEIPY